MLCQSDIIKEPDKTLDYQPSKEPAGPAEE